MRPAAIFALAALLTGCAQRRFALTNDADGLAQQHRFVAEVTCTNEQRRYYSPLRDQFSWGVMPRRVRMTVAFQVDRVLQGNITTNSFRLINARNKATPFCDWTGGFYFQTNTSYRVGFDDITRSGVKGLEIFTNSMTMPPQASMPSEYNFDPPPHGQK